MSEVIDKLTLWRQRFLTAPTPVLKEIAAAHVAVYEDVIRRRTK